MTGDLVHRIVDGNVTLFGKYSVDAETDMVTVHSPYGSKSTQLGGSPPQCLATIMLREMYQDRCTG